MRKFDLRKLLFLLLLAPIGGLMAQTPAPLIWGTSPFQDSMWSTDTTTYSVVSRVGPSLAGFTITGITGMAWDPIEHQTYVIMKLSGVSGRVLGTIDLATGVCTQVGNLGGVGANYSSITFRKDGQLFGMIGNGGSPAETMFTIDKHTATPTIAATLGNGADGEVICYNDDDDMIYHWSGNSTVVFEKFPAQAPYTPVTNIVLSGTSGGETFGAMYLGNGNFMISNISSNLRHLSTGGVYGANSLSNNPDDLRGLVMPPRFAFDSDTVCVGDSVAWYLMPGQAMDTAVYHWGDGTSTTVFPAGAASHVYATGGSFTSYAILKNDTVGEDTMVSAPIIVQALPNVALNPGTDTTMCLTDTLALVGASGGTLQWFMNGDSIIGATTANYTVTANGNYNMTKTNLNGCTDSASVGIKVIFGDQPVVDLGADSTLCDGDTICIALGTIPGETFLWSTGSTNASECFAIPGTYSVTAMDSVGCTETDEVVYTFISVPQVNVNVNTAGCPTVVFTDGGSGATSWAWSFGDGGTGTGSPTSHTYTSNGTYTGHLVASNQCFTVEDSGTITINCIIGVENAFSNAINVSPNPSNGSFMLNANLPTAGPLHYTVTDVNGRKLLDRSNEDVRSYWSEQIQLKAAAGVYFLTVESGADRAVYRILLEK